MGFSYRRSYFFRGAGAQIRRGGWGKKLSTPRRPPMASWEGWSRSGGDGWDRRSHQDGWGNDSNWREQQWEDGWGQDDRWQDGGQRPHAAAVAAPARATAKREAAAKAAAKQAATAALKAQAQALTASRFAAAGAEAAAVAARAPAVAAPAAGPAAAAAATDWEYLGPGPDDRVFQAEYFKNFRDFTQDFKQHNAALKYFRHRVDLAPWVIIGKDLVYKAALLHADKGMDYEFDFDTMEPWSWLEMIAQLNDESIDYVVNGPEGRSGGVWRCDCGAQAHTYDHKTHFQKLKAGTPENEQKLKRWDFVVWRADGTGVRLHPQWGDKKVPSYHVEPPREEVEPPKAGKGGTWGPGTYKYYKSLGVERVLKFDGTKAPSKGSSRSSGSAAKGSGRSSGSAPEAKRPPPDPPAAISLPSPSGPPQQSEPPRPTSPPPPSHPPPHGGGLTPVAQLPDTDLLRDLLS